MWRIASFTIVKYANISKPVNFQGRTCVPFSHFILRDGRMRFVVYILLYYEDYYCEYDSISGMHLVIVDVKVVVWVWKFPVQKSGSDDTKARLPRRDPGCLFTTAPDEVIKHPLSDLLHFPSLVYMFAFKAADRLSDAEINLSYDFFITRHSLQSVIRNSFVKI